MITADINLTVQTLHFRKQNNGFFGFPDGINLSRTHL